MTSEIIVEFPTPLTDKEKKMIYGYKGEVVRCKDCKLYEPNNFPIKTGHPCSRVGLKPNDFCSWVEPLWEDDLEEDE